MSNRRVVITGMGTVNPIGLGLEEYRQNLFDGTVGVDNIQSFDASKFPSQIAGESARVKMNKYVPKSHRKATKLMSRDIEMAVIAADDAIRGAKLVTKGTDPEGDISIEPTRSGVNVGAGLISCDLVELGGSTVHATENNQFSYTKWGNEGMATLTPLWLLKYLPNMLSCHISIIHDLQGPSNAITCADASGLLAIGEAYNLIKNDKADLMVAGGSESKVNGVKLTRQCFQKTASTNYNDRPKEACRPFDRDADGTAVAEGSGVIVLEELEHAQKRGADIYAELTGFGGSYNFSKDYVTPEADCRGVSIALEKAISNAKLTPNDINTLIPHGLAVATHDAAEAKAIHHVFKDHTADLKIFASKGQTGNCGAAAPTIDLINALLFLKEGKIAKTINCPNPNPDYGLNINQQATTEISIDHAATCCYTFGGQTAAVVISKYQG